MWRPLLLALATAAIHGAHAGCPSGWVDDDNGYCFLAAAAAGGLSSAHAARQHCRVQHGADLAHVPDATVRDGLYTKLSSLNVKRAYIGLVKIDEQFSWISGPANDYNNDVFTVYGCVNSTAHGADYTGAVSVTAAGRPCDRWDNHTDITDAEMKMATNESLADAANYCRNPNGSAGGPWCYTTDSNVPTEACDIPDCQGPGSPRCALMTSPGGTWSGDAVWRDAPCCFPELDAGDAAAAICAKPNTSDDVTLAPAADELQDMCFGDCPAGWVLSPADRCYGLVSTAGGVLLNGTFSARDVCRAAGGDLASAETPVAEATVLAVLRTAQWNGSEVFITYNDVRGAGSHVHESYESTHGNWKSGEPNSDAGACTLLEGAADWASIVGWRAADCCGPADAAAVLCQKPAVGNVSIPLDDDIFAAACFNATDECMSSPCTNGGTCADHVHHYTCECVPGYAGKNCETLIDYCESSPCQQGGTCELHVNSYTCNCPNAWGGEHCDKLIDPCWSNPCINNGTCLNDTAAVGSVQYLCGCMIGYTGINCETNVNDCENVTCKNNGTCQDGVNSFTCLCSARFTGVECETEYSCTPAMPTVHNATLTNNTGAVQGGYVTYACLAGMKFDDMVTTKTSACNEGVWEPDIDQHACTAHCDEIPTVVAAFTDGGNTRVGSVVNYTCDPGHRFPDNSSSINITCLTSGNWSTPPQDLPECEIVTCPALPFYPHQHLNTRNTTYSTVVTFWCDVGYQFHDNTTARTIKCLADGEWTAMLPPCQPVRCPALELPLQSVRNTSNNTYNTYAEYRCAAGLRMVDGARARVIKCDATAEWSDNVTDCADNRCFPLPYVGNSTPSTTDAIFNTKTKLTCIKGHRFDPGETQEREFDHMTCLTTGRWHPILSSCEPLYCPALRHVENAAVSENNTLFGTVVHYGCAKGHYVYEGSKPNRTVQTTECQADKTWSNDLLQPCWPIQCQPPPNVVNATTGKRTPTLDNSPSLFNYSDVVTYQCLEFEGFIYRFIDGKTERLLTCTENGMWDYDDVSCIKERCDPVPTIEHVVPDTRNTSWYTVVTYTCATGYTWPAKRFNGGNKTTHAITCQAHDGQWNETHPSLAQYYCDIKNCSAVPAMANATVNTTDFHYGTIVEYSCDIGFKYPDNETVKFRHCSDAPAWMPPNGVWTECEIVHCPELIDVENATRNTNDTEYNTHVTYSCLPGYQFPDKDKDKVVVCTENETWTEFPVGCEVVFCPPVPWWNKNSDFNSTENDFGSVVTYECKAEAAFEDELEALATIKERHAHVSGPRTAYCTKEKVWQPPIGNCIGKTSIASNLKGNTTESEGAVSIGTVCCSVMSVVLVGVVLLDLNKLHLDCKMARENIKHGLKQHKNKVSDSTTRINDDSGGNTAP